MGLFEKSWAKYSIVDTEPSKGTDQCPERTDEKKLQIFEEGRFLAFDFMSHELTDPSEDEDNQGQAKDTDMILLHDDQRDHDDEKQNAHRHSHVRR